jgi:hypothetical protein
MDNAIKDKAVLVGLSREGSCVYSEICDLGDYWDGDHLWDHSVEVRRVGLHKLHGYLFDESGALLQEFETVFNLDTGAFHSGWARHSDGTLKEHSP